ncbi:hypothetical protein D3C72_2549150 [compost metagenome]
MGGAINAASNLKQERGDSHGSKYCSEKFAIAACDRKASTGIGVYAGLSAIFAACPPDSVFYCF